MEQSKLEDRVREIFEEQGFKVEKKADRIVAENGKKIRIEVFSSEKYVPEEVQPEKNSLVFVDEGLSEIQEGLENEVSVIREKTDEPEYELPSYELIGEIAVINELVDIGKEEAVEGILAHHPRVKTVLRKKGGLEGEFRVGNYEKLYGKETETFHKEFGCRFKVDPTKTYFSERYGTERNRVISRIENAEKVLVMFAGVGPFAIMAAKNRNPEKVVAIEKNPEAFKYLKENIELNDVENTVEAYEGDVEEIIPELGKFDRVIMPLPESADKYLELAMKHTADEGIIHYYRFIEDQNWETVEKEVSETAEKIGAKAEITGRTVCGDRGPSVQRVCLDVRIHRSH